MPRSTVLGKTTILRSSRKNCGRCHRNKSASEYNTTQFRKDDGICRYCMHKKMESEGRAHPNKTKYPNKCKAHGLHHKCKE